MIPVKKRLGYGGAGYVNGYQLFITSGSLSSTFRPTYVEMIYTPPMSIIANRVQHATGVVEYVANISFDVYDSMMPLFSPYNGLFDRYYTVILGIDDGESASSLVDGKVTSVSISGSAGGLISAQLSVIGRNFLDGTVQPKNFIRDTEPLGYWYSGSHGADIKDWTLTMNQDVTTMYRNTSTPQPGYLKVGLTTYTLTVTSYKFIAPGGAASIAIGTRAFSLVGNTTSSDFSFGGQSDLGTYTYTFETSSQDNTASGIVILGT